MAVIAVVGGPGAPGATTTALALLLAWPLPPGRRIVLVECDPDGGAVLAGALEGRVEAVYGLRNLAVADRRGLLAQTLWEQLIDLSPEGNAERLLLPGLTDPTQAPGLAYTWEPLMDVLHGLEPQGYDVILDLGRSGATGTSAVLARRADVVAVTVRTTLRGLSAARPRLSALAEDLAAAGTGADALGLLLVAEGPYSGAEVAREYGLPVLGLLPHAARTARVLSDGGDITDRRFIRSELMRTARSAADEAQSLVRRRRQRLAPSAAPAQVGPAPAPEAEGPVSGYPAAPQPYGPVPQAPVITTGPVAPLAGLAPQPAAPAPFPAHVQPPPDGASAPYDGPSQYGQAEQGYGQAPSETSAPYGQAPYGGAPQYGASPQYGQADPQYGQAPYGGAEQRYGQAQDSGAEQRFGASQQYGQVRPEPARPAGPAAPFGPYGQSQPPFGQGPQQPPAGQESHVSYGEVLRAR
ncbi:hypothetical protein [Kitasatospora sp. NPDC091207]|uniref:hypothetical protein n=1 Tax=Kitasatospora sp. NPDC091207 TaxID=3364083 RepID=UPI00382A9360